MPHLTHPATTQSGHGGRTGTRTRAPPSVPPPLPVNRILGYGLAASTLPTQQRPRNPTEESHRIEALRHQLRHPYALNTGLLRYMLVNDQWDVNRAAERFRRENGLLMWPHTHPDRRLGSRRGHNVESSRLHVLEDTVRTLGNQDSTYNGTAGDRPPRILSTNPTSLIELFRQNSWVPRRAMTDIATRRGAYEDIAEGLIGMRIPPTTIGERDERLAWFISVTATNSWYSARVLLENNGWDIGQAIEVWITEGGVPFVPVPSRTNNRGRVIPEVDNDGMRGISVDEPAIDNIGNDSDADSEVEWSVGNGANAPLDTSSSINTTGTGYGGGETNIRSGHLIDGDREPARVNCPDASKLRIETISGLEYKIRFFSGRIRVGSQNLNFRWSDDDNLDHSNETEFDWSNGEHITKLNRWREEYFRRATGENLQDERIPFNKYERDWLREREAMRYEEEFYNLAGQDPQESTMTDPAAWAEAQRTFGENTHNLPRPITGRELQQLTAKFNTTFAGKTFYQKVTTDGKTLSRSVTTIKLFETPRPRRTKNSIQSERSRGTTLCRHFLWKLKPSANGLKDADDVSSEEDSDVEEAGKAGKGKKRGRGGDGGGGHPAKRGRR